MNRIGLWYGAMAAVAAGAALMGGCLPDDMPAYTNGGKTVVAVAQGPSGQALWTYDVQSGKVTPYSLPDKWQLQSARMLGDQVWVRGGLRHEQDPAKHWEHSCKRFDPVKNEFVAGPPALEGRDWLSGAIPASDEGKMCLFVPSAAQPANNEGKIDYDVFSFPEIKQMKWVKLDQVIPAGRFWWLTLKVKKQKDGSREIGNVDLFNAEGKKVVTITNEEGRKMKYQGGREFPAYARLSEDFAVLLLALGEQGGYNFGVFDTGTGKFLWGGSTRFVLKGNPLVKRTEVWAIEGRSDIALVRHTPGEEAGKDKQDRYVINPANPGADQLTPSPDGSHFVMVINGGKDKPSRLLFIPIKEGVAEKDVRSVELKTEK